MSGWGPEGLLVVSVALAALPMLIVTGTCYLKFSIVLGLLRSGFGTQQTPGNSVVLGLAAALSLVVMQPVLSDTAERLTSVKVAEVGKLTIGAVGTTARQITGPWRRFLITHAGERELEFFDQLAASRAPLEKEVFGPKEPDLTVALGSFVLSEVKKGFLVGFILLLPFFVIDVVVANILVGMGLTMMSPITVALPLKVVLFVTADGWLLIASNLVKAY